MSPFWKSFGQLIRASARLSYGNDPEMNGQTERWKEQETGLCCLASHDPLSWLETLLWVEYAHNTQPSPSMGLTPFHFLEVEPEVNVPLAIIMTCAATRCGPGPGQRSSDRQTPTRGQQISRDEQLLLTLQARGCGCPWSTFLYE